MEIWKILAVIGVSGSLISASLADESADVARVEQEIQVAEEAVAIHSRARERARKAVQMSSLGRELRRVEDEWKKFERGEEIKEPASRLREKRIVYRRKIDTFVKRMTKIFLDDEIKIAREKKRHSLLRELRKLLKGGTEI